MPRVRYEDNSIILKIQTRKDKLVCPQCKSRHIIRSGSHIRRIRNVPIGNKQVIKNVKVQRINTDETTDHFVVINGRGYDENKGQYYFNFIDTGYGKYYVQTAFSDNNRLYYNPKENSFKSYNNDDVEYILVQIRPNNNR